jgi:hypothetical protein
MNWETRVKLTLKTVTSREVNTDVADSTWVETTEVTVVAGIVVDTLVADEVALTVLVTVGVVT